MVPGVRESRLVVIGVLTPQTDVEHNLTNVEEVVRRHEIPYPVAGDTDLVTWWRFDNWAWPAMYLVDKRGMIRPRQIGEGWYGRTEAHIRTLLAEDA